MAYYDASGIIDGSGNLNVSTLIDSLDSQLAVRRGLNKVEHFGSPDSTSSTTFITLDTFSITNLGDTDLVDVVTYVWCSCGTANEAISCELISSTGGGSYEFAAPQITSPYADTNGERDLYICTSEFYGYTGTLSVDFKWRVSSGAGPIYSAKRYHQWTIQKRRS